MHLPYRNPPKPLVWTLRQLRVQDLGFRFRIQASTIGAFIIRIVLFWGPIIL